MIIENQYGKDSILKIKTIGSKNGTILENAEFTAPLKVTRPFPLEHGGIQIMIMNSSSGVLSGDVYHITIDAGENSRLEITGQSYTKVHRMEEGSARQDTVINVEMGANVFYTPPPVIPYAKSSFESTTTVNLKEGGTVFISDIVSCGRKMRDEIYKFTRYKSVTRVYREQELLFLDNLLLEPELIDCIGMGWFESYSHQGTVIYFSEYLTKNITSEIANILYSYYDILPGISSINQYGFLIRILGNKAETLEKIINRIKDYIIKMEGEKDAFNS